MKGGYQILDLRNIGISYSSETKNITDPEILDQLRNLREYIEKGHNYSSALNNSLKCVMIRYRDAKVSEKWEECEFATINSSNASLTYEIKGKELRIEVVFEEKQDDDGNPYYDIKTAKYLYNQNVIIGGNLIVGGDAKIFENIVDKDGHERFIEGDITIETITGITKTYGKWSLSGSHLLIVLCVAIANATEFDGTIASINIPEWIKDKIIPQFVTVVEAKDTKAYNINDASSQPLVYVLRKDTSKNVYITISNFTASKDRVARLSFDLLIDNEEQA